MTLNHEVHIWRFHPLQADRQILIQNAIDHYLGYLSPRIRTGKGLYGKPYLLEPHSDIFFNVSHSGKIGLIAISNDEIGIDIERVSNFDIEELCDEALAKEEIDYLKQIENDKRTGEFYRLWSRKEAMLKFTGEGISHGTSHVSVLMDIVTLNDQTIHLQDLNFLQQDFRGALCTKFQKIDIKIYDFS